MIGHDCKRWARKEVHPIDTKQVRLIFGERCLLGGFSENTDAERVPRSHPLAVVRPERRGAVENNDLRIKVERVMPDLDDHRIGRDDSSALEDLHELLIRRDSRFIVDRAFRLRGVEAHDER